MRRTFAASRFSCMAPPLLIWTGSRLKSRLPTRRDHVGLSARSGGRGWRAWMRATRAPGLRTVVIIVAALGLLGSCRFLGPGVNRQTVVYVASGENFANPERGLASSRLPPDPNPITWDPCGAGNNFTAYDYTEWTPALRPDEL